MYRLSPNLNSFRWIASKISESLGNEDDVVIELCFNLLEGSRFVSHLSYSARTVVLILVDSLISKHCKSPLPVSLTKTRPDSARNYGAFASVHKATLKVCLKSCLKRRSWNCYKRRLMRKRQLKRRAVAKSRDLAGIEKLTQLDKKRGLNVDVDEDEAMLPVGAALSMRVGRENQGRLQRSDEARQRDGFHQGVRLTHIYQE
jgi:PWI domain